MSSFQRERIYYEIAMSIGNSLDLDEMLKQGLSTYLRKINGLAGAVLQRAEDEHGKNSFEMVYAIPRRMRRNSAVKEALERIPSDLGPEQLEVYMSGLPLQNEVGGLKRYLMELPGFGLLLLVKSAPGLSLPELKSLAPLNAKLADACTSCVANTRLQQEIRDRKMVEEKYRSIFDNAVDGIFQASLDGHFLEANSATARILGYDSSEQLIAELTDLQGQFYVNPDVRDRYLGKLLRRGTVAGYEIEFYRRDGSTGWVSSSARLVRDEEGEPLYIEGVIKDITTSKQAVFALREARKEAQRLSNLKSNFISMVSHELRTPLTSILGFTKITRKRMRDILKQTESCPAEIVPGLERVVSNTEIVISEGERLAELINNILDLSKLESGEYEWHMADFSLNEALHHSIAATEVLFDEMDIALEWDIQPELPSVYGDRDRIVQVIINLLSNAVKFTEVGTVTVAASLEGEQIIVKVIDTGLGVSEEEADIIFDKFRQLGDVLTDKPRGTGLGLSISQEIMEHHSGSLWYQPNEAGGSIFGFSMPVKSD